MSVENEVLSAVVRDGSFKEMLDRGLDEKFFADESLKLAYRKLFEFWSRYDKFPDGSTLKKMCPDVALVKVGEPLRFYAEELQKKFRENQVRSSFRKVADLLGKDSEAAIVEINTLVMGLSTTAFSRDRKLLDSVKERKASYLERKLHKGIMGLGTGFPALDEGLGGLNREDFVIIAGRPKVGKSFLLCQIATALYKQGKTALFFTKEMSIKAIQTRFEALLFELPYTRFKHGHLTADEERHYMKGMDELKDGQIIFVQDAHSVGALVGKAKEYKPDCILLDGLYLLDDPKSKSPWEKVTNISRDLKKAAQMLSLPLIATHQLNRGSEDEKSPTMKNLAYADALCQDADAVMAVYQDQHMREDKEMYLRLIGAREADRLTLKLKWDLDNGTIAQDTLDKDGGAMTDEDFMAGGPMSSELVAKGKRL